MSAIEPLILSRAKSIGKFNIRNNKETDDIQRHKWDNIGNITLFIESKVNKYFIHKKKKDKRRNFYILFVNKFSVSPSSSSLHKRDNKNMRFNEIRCDAQHNTKEKSFCVKVEVVFLLCVMIVSSGCNKFFTKSLKNFLLKIYIQFQF